jgi:hypothetical protein
MMARLRLGLLLCITLFGAAAGARGDDASREAGKHFQRGVDLYNDGDYRGALVEFKKAYSLWPRASVLYDIGQTEFQMLDYAAALRTMERFLSETGANAAHRAEVENTVEVLRGRVGSVALTADASDCDVAVDDQSAGTTPLRQPLLVSVGPHKISVTCAGRPPSSKHVEVAATETVRVELHVAPPPPAAVRSAVALAAAPPSPELGVHRDRQGMLVSWTVASLLSAATLAFGVSALVESERLNGLKQSFPVARGTLDSQANLTTGLSITTDALGIAAIAAVGVATYYTVKYTRDRKLHLGFSGTGAMLRATF